MRRWLLVLIALVLVVPATVQAKKKKQQVEPKPHPVGHGAELESLTVQVPGTYSRVSSADLSEDPNVGPGETVVLASLEGPAVVDRIWIAIEGSDTYWRDIVLQITWDGASSPSIEAPIGDFFAVGPGARQNLQSAPIAVQSAGRSFVSLWKMPFAKSARIALVNEGASSTRQVRWEVEYRKLEMLAPGSLYFHAQYTQANPPVEGRPMTVLRASGHGQYVGLSLVAQNTAPGAWGTGAINFEVDGARDKGPGSVTVLNYFGNIFGLAKVDGAYQGVTLDEGDRVGARSSVYRWHITDPVPFNQSILIQVDHGPENQRTDRLAAVTYWYQDAPQVPFEKLATARERRWPAPSDAELVLWRRADQLHVEVVDAYRRLDYDSALTLLEELLGLEPESVYASYNLACLYALAGQSDKALHMLEQAIELGFTELGFARHDPDLASLHEHERFGKLVGATAEAEAEAPK